MSNQGKIPFRDSARTGNTIIIVESNYSYVDSNVIVVFLDTLQECFIDKLVRQLNGEGLVLTLFPVAFLARVTRLLSRTTSVTTTKMCLCSTFFKECEGQKKFLCTVFDFWCQFRRSQKMLTEHKGIIRHRIGKKRKEITCKSKVSRHLKYCVHFCHPILKIVELSNKNEG